MSNESQGSPTVVPCGVAGGVTPHHESAPTRAHTGSAGGVSALPVAFGFRNNDGSFDVTTDVDHANSWVNFAEDRVFGLYLDHQPAEESESVRDLIGWSRRALIYLEHPDVQALGFAAHPGVVANEIRAAIAALSTTEAR